MEQLTEKISGFLQKIPKSYYLPILISVAGIILLSIGLIQLFLPAKQDTAQTVQNTFAPTPLTVPKPQTADIAVDVEGALTNPGVYKLPKDARVQDALIAAGGLSGDADREVVAKQINLAAKLQDGTKIYIPKIGDSSVIPAQQSASGVQVGIQGQAGTVLGASTGLININTAAADQLDSLPGIGPVTAQKIIAARPFTSTQDLLTKKVVSKTVFVKIKDQITAN